MIPLAGHTRGHTAYALTVNGKQTILHAGDAFFDHRILGNTRQPLMLTVFGTVVAYDRKQVLRSPERIAELRASTEPSLRIINSHDPALLPTSGKSSSETPSMSLPASCQDPPRKSTSHRGPRLRRVHQLQLPEIRRDRH